MGRSKQKASDIVINYDEHGNTILVADDEEIWSGFFCEDSRESLSDILETLGFNVDLVELSGIVKTEEDDEEDDDPAYIDGNLEDCD